MLKKLLASLLLLVSWQAHAAISFVRYTEGYGSGSPVAITLGGACAVNDLLLAIFHPYTGVSPAPTYAISDNVDVGAWNKPASLQVYLSSPQLAVAIFWIKCDTAGTPTVTLSGFAGDGFLELVQYTGFTNGPSFVTADVTSNSSNSGTTFAATPLTNTQTNELIIAATGFFDGANASAITGSFTTEFGTVGNPGVAWGDVVEATTGNTLNFGGSIGGTNAWITLLAGFVNASAGASCTHSGYTTAGAIATPNGTTGSYLGKTGAMVTPDCSTVNYWSPALGNFTTN